MCLLDFIKGISSVTAAWGIFFSFPLSKARGGESVARWRKGEMRYTYVYIHGGTLASWRGKYPLESLKDKYRWF